MASLRSIINVDDDHPIKTPRESVPSFARHPESSASTSASTLASTSALASQQRLDAAASSPSLSAGAQIPTPSSRSPHPAAPEASSSSSPFPPGYALDSATPARRQSATSTHSMDCSFGQSRHGHLGAPYPGATYPGATYAGAPVRPFVPAGDAPIKLTPITGKVSRAKKGLAVHTCDTCRPPKTFTRAEHLRRHQLSHQPPGLPCQVPGCDRVFRRKDLLERHQQRHEQDEGPAAAAIATRRPVSHPHGSGSSPQRSFDDGTSRAPLPVPPALSSPPLGSRPTSAPSGHRGPLGHENWSLAASSSPMRDPQEHLTLERATPAYPMDSMSIDPLPRGVTPGFKPDSEPDLELIDVPEMCGPEVGSESSVVSWQGEDVVVRSAPSSIYSTPPPSDASRGHHAAVRPPGAAWAQSIEPSAVSGNMPMDTDSYPLTSLGYNASLAQAYPTPSYADMAGMAFPGFDDGLYGSPAPGATARSLSPQMAVGPCSETLVTAPTALPGDRMLYPTACGLPPETTLGLLTADDLMPSLSSEVVGAMPTYLGLYWDKVHPMYPIIHRATFEEASDADAEHMDVLRCAMAAVATQFLGHRQHRINGSHLQAHAWRKLENIVCSMPDATSWPLPVMQAVLLCEYYARFRGRSKEAYRPSPRFNELCQTVAGTQTEAACQGAPPDRATSQGWRLWVCEESRRRLAAACFLLSVHGNWYYEQPLTADLNLDKFSPMMLPIALSASSTQAWAAETAEKWAPLDAAGIGTQMVGDVLQQPLTPAMIESMPAFDASILLAAHALQLPRRRTHTEVDVAEDAPMAEAHYLPIMRLFPRSPVAYVYLALHHTPLHWLLSVSGDSWVFNKKVDQPRLFVEHQRKLETWRSSGSAAVATLFAAKALKMFLRLEPGAAADGHGRARPGAWRDISDFWGVYVCALVCWAAGHGEKRGARQPTRAAAVRWLLGVAELEALPAQGLCGREHSRAVVGLAREALERDCLDGRSILFLDAVGVLRKLEEGDSCRRF